MARAEQSICTFRHINIFFFFSPETDSRPRVVPGAGKCRRGEAAGFYSERQSGEMEKAGMQVAYLELYCNMPALQLMQIHPPQKKKKTECYFPGRFCCRDHRPPLPLCLYPHGNPSAQIKTQHHQLHSSRSWISVLHHRSGGGTGTASARACARACVCARERKKKFLGWCDIRVASCDPLRLVPFRLFRQDRRNDETSYYRVRHFRSGVIYASRSRKRALRGLLGDEYV